MFSSVAEVEMYGKPEEAWSKLANFQSYDIWSPCFTFAHVANNGAIENSKIKFHISRFKDRLRRTAVIEKISAPDSIVLSFARPYFFWLKETWTISVKKVESEELPARVLVTMGVEYSGWMKVKTFRREALLTKTFFEAHLEGLKEELESLGDLPGEDFLDMDDYDEEEQP